LGTHTRAAIMMPGVLLAALLWSASSANAQEAEEGITLDDAIDAALAHNPQVVLAQRGVDIAEAATRLAKLPDNLYFALFTNTDLQGPLTTIEFPDPANPGQTQRYTLGSPITANAGLTATKPLLAGRQEREAKRAAQAGVRAAAKGAEQTLLEVVLGVKQAYYGVQTAFAMRDVAKEAVDRARSHLRIAEARVELGDAAPLEQMQAQVDMASAEQGLVAAEGQVTKAIGALNVAMGVEVTQPTVVQRDGEGGFATFGYGPIFELAQVTRPEVAALDERIAQAEHEAKRVATLDDPSLDLTGTYNYSVGSAFQHGNTFQIGLGLTWPIFDKGSTKAQRRQADAQVEQIRAQRPVLLQAISLEVHGGVTELATAKQKVEVMRKALDTAREAYRVSRIAYEGGVGSRIDAKDSLLALTSAQADLVTAVHEYRLALAQIEHAAGVRALGSRGTEGADEQ